MLIAVRDDGLKAGDKDADPKLAASMRVEPTDGMERITAISPQGKEKYYFVNNPFRPFWCT